jgi:hypothetical protein
LWRRWFGEIENAEEVFMNVNTIAIKQDTAVQKIADIKALSKSQRTEDDDALLSLYTSVAKHGARVITLSAAFKQAGLNELRQPRIAIAQADWGKVFFKSPWTADHREARGEFWHRSMSWRRQNAAGVIHVRAGSFDAIPTNHQISSLVPYVPANVRPKFNLRNYHILFEVEKWTVEMPVDPFLLKHIMGDTYAVIAEWELTELETQLLGGMRSGN